MTVLASKTKEVTETHQQHMFWRSFKQKANDVLLMSSVFQGFDFIINCASNSALTVGS